MGTYTNFRVGARVTVWFRFAVRLGLGWRFFFFFVHQHKNKLCLLTIKLFKQSLQKKFFQQWLCIIARYQLL